MSSFIYMGLYLLAIILANLLVTWFGPNISILNAFLFIGLDLTSRDKLHDAWSGKYFLLKMGGLIATGSFISWLLNKNSGQIALASFVAFGLAALIDTIVYYLLRNKIKIVQINGSNIISALVDSFTFPTIAFGFPLMFGIMLGQFVAKVLGGFIWSLILRKKS